MKKLKVLTVVGTRPEIIRLSRVLAKLNQYCEHILVHTGQNYDYELNQVFKQEALKGTRIGKIRDQFDFWVAEKIPSSP